MVGLKLPDISMTSDDGLDEVLKFVDGAWSRQTRALVVNFSATGLDLNHN